MPWRLKQRVGMILFGVVSLVISIVVLIHNESLSTELLGAIGVVGGLAMILISLPSNNNNSK